METRNKIKTLAGKQGVEKTPQYYLSFVSLNIKEVKSGSVWLIGKDSPKRGG